MLKHVYLIFIATFIFGFISGSILFLMNNTGNEGDGAIPKIGDTSIVVTAYGDCAQAGCASYRIESNGAYTYILRNGTEEKDKITNSLSSAQKKALFDAMDVVDFQKVTESRFRGSCPGKQGGISYRYVITQDSVPYSFDSCMQKTDGRFFEILKEYFEIFKLTHDS